MGSEILALGDFIDSTGGSIQTGPFGTKLKAAEYTATGVPVISVGEVGYGRIRLHERTPKVDNTIWQRMPEYLLKTDDIVFGRKGAVDRSAHIQPEENGYFLGSDGIRVRLNPDECDPKFVAYQFQSEAHKVWMIQHAAGTTMPSLNEGIIRRIPITLPPLPEQKAIAHILGSLDDKIELNRKMNATLEGMAQALFKSWFVDFDPVIDNALAAGNPIPDELADRAEVRRQALTDGTANREAAKPFPANFQQSDIMGWIPEGWEMRPLDQVADFKNGLALQKFRPKLGENPLPIVKIAQLQTGDATWDELASPSISPYCIIDDGDVVFSWSGSLMIDVWCGGKAALNQHLFKVTSNDFSKWFYFKWSRQHLNNFQKIAADKAVTMGHIKRSHLSEALCVVPCKDLIKIGSDHFDPILERIIRNRLHSRCLTRLRDTLLPKLISGELRIQEAEQLTEEALI